MTALKLPSVLHAFSEGNDIVILIHKFINRIFKSNKINPPMVIIISFAAVILVGACLLSLPAASKDGEFTSFLSSLFTATSATCVTGLIMFDTFTHWSVFGQIVILLLIQTGGLGFVSIMMLFLMIRNASFGMKSKLMIMQNFGLESMEGIVSFFRHVLVITFGVEAVGAVLLGFVYVPMLGIKGIWPSIFHSVSAFCNAGFDINGFISEGVSMSPFYNNYLVLIVLSCIISISGVGFFVWEDLYLKRNFKKTTLYTKIVVIMTLFLLISGTVVFFFTEYNNPATIGTFTVGEKLINSFFQSATLRTAGFESFPQKNLTDAGKLFSVIYMFIGGSAGSTAGGVKTATVFIALAAMISALRGNRDTVVMKRRIGHRRIISAFAVILLALILDIFGALFVSMYHGLSLIDCLYETVSAYATVGVTVGVTGELNFITKLLYILYMFMGRVGVTTIGIMIISKNMGDVNMKYPKEDIIIG